MQSEIPFTREREREKQSTRLNVEFSRGFERNLPQQSQNSEWKEAGSVRTENH